MATDTVSLVPVGDDESAWRSVVETHADSTVFHTWEWLGAVESVFGYEPRHYLVTDATGEAVGAVPGFAAPEFVGQSVVNPFCEYGFPLVEAGVSVGPVLDILSSELGTLEARIIKDVAWSSVEGFAPAGYGAHRVGVASRLHLDDYETLWETAYDGEARRGVRQAREQGVEVREGTVEEYYPLYLATMRRRGSPQFPSAFFEALARRLDASAFTIFVAERAGDVVAGVLLLEWGDETVLWGNASRRSTWEHRPNHRLYDAVVERAARTEQSVVDFGRSRPDSGVQAFKAQFGGRPHRLVSFVDPPHRVGRASLATYEGVEPLVRRLGGLVTHPSVGPRLKRFIHE